MNAAKRRDNEKEFDSWIELGNGGRIYSFIILGKHGWTAKYLKEVDSTEKTTRFWQEIYDENNVLKEIHQKYPVDTRHQKV